jgi:hypothetical protein
MARNSLKSPMAECLLVSPLDHLDGLDGWVSYHPLITQ